MFYLKPPRHISTLPRRYCHVRSFVRYPPHRTLPRRERERRRPGAQAHANRVGRLSPRPPPRTGPAHRGGRERSSHHGIEKRTAAHPRSRLKRKNGKFWSAQFCTEVAHSERFELPTLGIEIRCSIQLSYECTSVFNGLDGCPHSLDNVQALKTAPKFIFDGFNYQTCAVGARRPCGGFEAETPGLRPTGRAARA
jgi:hypothetical protein